MSSAKATERLVALSSSLSSKPLMTHYTSPDYTPLPEDSIFPWNPDRDTFPPITHLPKIDGAPTGAAWVWGKEDGLGRLNLLTPKRVLRAKEEILTGEVVPINLPLNQPSPPFFGREEFKHTIKTLKQGISYDDLYTLNTQSGTQWDGFRHFSHMSSQTFYNNTSPAAISSATPDPTKISIHHWSNHGIVGRGFLLDYHHYACSTNNAPDLSTPHSITLADLAACAASQGMHLFPSQRTHDAAPAPSSRDPQQPQPQPHPRPGDILVIRTGFTAWYAALDRTARNALAQRHGSSATWTGLAQTEEMAAWLHDSYFAAVGSDAPALERWPTATAWLLHERLLALWGVPIGELWDLERLAEKCRERKRWTFWFSSVPANVVGGVGSAVNGMAVL